MPAVIAPPPRPTLRVVSNPYAAIDEHGRPAGAVILDPSPTEKGGHHPYHDDPTHRDPAKRWKERRFVGATRVVRRLGSKAPRVMKFRRRDGSVYTHTYAVPHDRAWSFATEAVEVPNSSYYQTMIRDSALFAADLASWVKAGFDKALWVEPAQRLAWAKEGAIAHLVACHYPSVIGEHRAACVAHDEAHQAHVGAHQTAYDEARKIADPKGRDAAIAMVEQSTKAPQAPAMAIPDEVLADYRIQNLALHWSGRVEQTHPVGKAIAAATKTNPAAATQAADAATAAATRLAKADDVPAPKKPATAPMATNAPAPSVDGDAKALLDKEGS
jgi:hypothetical protein